VSPFVLTVPLGMAMLGVHRGFGGATARAVLRDAGGGLSRVVAVGVAVASGAGAWVIGLAFALGAGLSDAAYVSYGVLRGWVGRGGRGFEWALLQRLRGFAPLHMIGELRRWLDLLVAGVLIDPFQLGLYALSRGFVRVLEVVQLAPVHTFLPTAGSLDDIALRPVHQRVRRITLSLLWAPLTACLVMPDWILVSLVGVEYAAAAPLLAWLAAASVADVAVGYNQEVLLARGGERVALVVNVMTSAATVGLLFALTPRWGAMGAAAGLLIARAGRVLALALLVRARGYRPPPTALPVYAMLGVLALVAGLRWSVTLPTWVLALLTVGLGLGGAAVLGWSELRARTAL
jgi:O-antigen/teichoic acid export membrane protein